MPKFPTKGGKEVRKRIVAFIRSYTEKYNLPPTRREIMEGAGISSTSVVNFHLTFLRKIGAVEWHDGLARYLRVSHNADELLDEEV